MLYKIYYFTVLFENIHRCIIKLFRDHNILSNFLLYHRKHLLYIKKELNNFVNMKVNNLEYYMHKVIDYLDSDFEIRVIFFTLIYNEFYYCGSYSLFYAVSSNFVVVVSKEKVEIQRST